VLKVVAWIAGICLALVFVSVIGLWLLLDPVCSSDILMTLPSPDREHKAILFQRKSGTSTGFSTQISVLRANQVLGDNAGNIFVADTDHGAAPSGPDGGPAVQVQWAGTKALTVLHHPKARVFSAEPESHGVQITYKAME
jgi:hypothetical protein